MRTLASRLHALIQQSLVYALSLSFFFSLSLSAELLLLRFGILVRPFWTCPSGSQCLSLLVLMSKLLKSQKQHHDVQARMYYPNATTWSSKQCPKALTEHPPSRNKNTRLTHDIFTRCFFGTFSWFPRVSARTLCLCVWSCEQGPHNNKQFQNLQFLSFVSGLRQLGRSNSCRFC